MPEFTEFTEPSYRLETPNSASSRLVNLMPELIEKGPRAGKFRLRNIPGLRDFATLPDQPLRELLQIDSGNRLFAVSGSTVYEVFGDGTFLAMTGNVANSSHPAIMRSNGFQLAIASGGQLYLVNGISGGGGTVTPLNFTDGSPIHAATLDFLDQYFIVSIIDSKQIFISNLAPDGATWDPGDTAIKEGYADNISRIFADNEQLWLFGFDTTEPFVNTGAIFPFQRIQNVVLKIGCSAPYSVAGIQGNRFWFWNGVVYWAYGLAPQRISDHGVEESIKTYGTTVDAEGFCYMSNGDPCYVLTFPTARRTWAYNLNLKAWHERLFWSAGQWSQYRPRVYARAFGKDLVGDSRSGKIYQMDPTYYFDADNAALRRQRICPYITDQNRNYRYDQLTLDMDTGIGLDVGPGFLGYDPTVIMRYSDNRGKKWSNERQASAGRIGQVDTRVIFNQIGASRIGKVFDVVMTDPVPTVYNTAYLKTGAPEVGR